MKKTLFQKFILLSVLILFLGVFIFSNVPRAQAVTDFPAFAQRTVESVQKFAEWFKESAIGTAFKQGAKVFLSQVAYDTATYIATGGRGQEPLFEGKNFQDATSAAGDAALGTFMDELTQDWTDFDVCNPAGLQGPTVKFNIHYSLFRELGPGSTTGEGTNIPKARCKWSEIKDNWDQWIRDVGEDPSQFTSGIKAQFQPEQNDLGIYLTLQTNILEEQEEARVNAALERTVNQGLKDITSPITRTIKTPAVLLGNHFRSVDEKTGEVELTYTGEIVDAFLSTFTNTLMSKWMDTLFKKGFDSGSRVTSFANFIVRSGGRYSGGGQKQFGELAEVSFTSGEVSVIDKLVLPKITDIAGPTAEVITNGMAGAIRGNKTLIQAINDGDINKDAVFGFNSDKTTQPSYREGLPYRSLVILRTHRIIPVGWELAAMYNSRYGEKDTINLSYLIDCFEDPLHPNDAHYPKDCREDTNSNGQRPNTEDRLFEEGDLDESFVFDFNPFYHLVDPNWVLKSPKTYCEKQGFGTELYQDEIQCSENNVVGTNIDNSPIETPYCDAGAEFPDIPVRTVIRAGDYCGDWKSCISYNDDGSCKNYGYCVEEKSVWRFEGESCEDYYNSCETFTNVTTNTSVSYLRDTLLECDQSEAGCSWYSTNKVADEWSKTDRIYLNNQASQCSPSNAGCRELILLKPGINLVENGNFAFGISSGWETGNQCLFNVEAGQMNISGASCQLFNSGYIPVSSEYAYHVSYKIKSDQEVTSTLSITEYVALASGQPGSSNGSTDLSSGAITVSDDFTTKEYEIGSATNNSLAVSSKFIKLDFSLNSGSSSNTKLDDIQLVILRSPIVEDNTEGYSIDSDQYIPAYSDTTAHSSTRLKVQPEYLDCSSDNPECDQYVNYCSQADVGCEGYTPVLGGSEVPAKLSSGDICSNQCVGYENFLELGTYFEEIEDATFESSFQNFIPSTGKSCSAQHVGCEQFTNLDEVSSGGEGLEYFSYLRQCVSEASPNISSYFTWEGSDTTGFQLKKWQLLNNNITGGVFAGAPCTHLNLSDDSNNFDQTCDDTAETIEAWSSSCPEGNLNCREFITSSGDPYYIDQRYVITASSECHPYRRTSTGQIFNADPFEGVSCPALANQCKEYKGGGGNNIFNVFEDGFEDGSIGDFNNTDNSNQGLSNVNTTVYVGEHSLFVATDNNSIIKTLNGINFSENKQYELTFWAMSIPFDSQKYIVDNTDYSNYVNFELNDIGSNWQEYRVGPIQINNNIQDPTIRIAINNIGSGEAYVIDEIVLEEYSDKFFMVKDSWNTPAICDLPTVGTQLNCQEYTDRDNEIHYLKSFDYICSPNNISCEAFIDTHNSSQQKEEVFTALCNSSVGIVEDNVCSIRGVEKCIIQDGEFSCSYENITVKNDEIVYIVNDPSKECSEKGCSLVGVPVLDRQNEYYSGGDYETYLENYITDFNTSYLINDPDEYPRQLCSESALYCTEFNGDFTGQNYYFDPIALSEDGFDRTCTYNLNQAKWLNSSGDLCSSSKFMPSSDQEGYEGWVGTCESYASSCTEYRDPENPYIDGVQQCDALISPQMKGVCGDEASEEYITLNGKTYCQKNINGVDHFVCEAIDLPGDDFGIIPCPYTENDWTCFLDDDISNTEGEYCKVEDSTVCYAPAGSSSCTYSIACQAYYTKANTVEYCDDGIVDRGSGCVPFNDTSVASISHSSKQTLDGNVPTVPESCLTNFSDSAYCNSNTVIQVAKDRECSETLFCTSSIEVQDEFGVTTSVCLDIGRCSKIDPNNPDNCLKLETSIDYSEQTYNFLDLNGNPEGVERIRNLSGYSKAGLIWNTDKVIAGYYPPELMLETGRSVAISNSSFEIIDSVSGLSSWQFGEEEYCNYGIENNNLNVYDGTYSLSVDLSQSVVGEDGNFNCSVVNQSQISIDPNMQYNLSFYAKSSNGSQKIKVGLTWLDGSGDELSNSLEIFTPNVNWQRFLISYEPSESNSEIIIPDGAVAARITIDAPTTEESGGTGLVWFDKFSIEPGLFVSDDKLLTKDCRLYPTDNAPSCNYSDLKQYNGWHGYCLEYDPNNQEACIQWYPVDNISGESLISLGDSATSYYTGPMPLYYCLESTSHYKETIYNGNQCWNWGSNMQCGYDGFEWSTEYIEVSNEEHEWYYPGEDYTSFYTDGDNQEIWNIKRSDIHKIEARTISNGGDKQFPNPGETFTLLEWSDDNSLFFAYCRNSVETDPDKWNNEDGSCDSSGEERVGVKVKFDINGNIEEIEHYGHDDDGDGNNQDTWGYQLIFHLKESCSYLVKTVKDTSESGQKEKAWFTRYNNNWDFDEGNEMGYMKSNMVEDSYLYGSVSEPSAGDPYSWNSIDNPAVPLNIHSGSNSNIPNGSYEPEIFARGGLPFSTYTGHSVSNRECLGGFNEGNTCINSSECEDDSGADLSGICIGVGDYCYNSANISNGQACNASIECFDSKYPTCRKPILATNRMCYTDSTSGVTNNQICATDLDCPQVQEYNTCSEIQSSNNGVLYCLNASGETEYTECADSEDNADNDICTEDGELDYVTCGNLTDTSSFLCTNADGNTNNTSCDIANGNQDCLNQTLYPVCLGEPLELADVLRDRVLNLFAEVYGVYKWEDGHYEDVTDDFDDADGKISVVEEEGVAPQVTNIELNDSSGVITLTAPGGAVNLSFNTIMGNPDQLPIEEILIKWNDGPSPSDIQSFSGPINNRPQESSPHKVKHVYSCVTNTEGDRCSKCWDTNIENWIDADDGICYYSGPTISVKDHWGWCSSGIYGNERCDLGSSPQFNGQIQIIPR